jgi:CHAT domain-containing protein
LVTQDSEKGSNGSAVFGGLLYNNDRIPYLKGTLIEANNITQILHKIGSSEFTPVNYTRNLGTKEVFKSLDGKGKRIIHVATHGFFLSAQDSIFGITHTDNPLTHSGLCMAASKSLKDNVNNYNGIISSQEISQMNLHGLDLAVLSACETGQGQILGDGVFGLQRGFKMAGTQSLLMSLWKVDDLATQMLMTQFYGNWLIKKMPKQKALKVAQDYVRNYEVDEIEWAVELRKQRNERGSGGGNFRSKATTGKGRANNKKSRMIKPFQAPRYWAAFILLDGLD